MKLARIILPIVDNAGNDLFFAHQELKHVLLKEFGGCTTTHGNGAWMPPAGGLPVAEPVMIYDVAMDRAATVVFRSIAARVARVARQECVMIVTPNGDVEFVKPENNSAQTA